MSITIDGMGITLRPFTDSDRNFVLGTWLNSGLRTARRGDPSPFFRWARPIIEEHVSLDEIRIACMADDPGVIISWAALHNGRPAYAYTVDNRHKGVSFRGHGLMRALTESP